MGREPGLTRRGFNRAVAQASRVVDPAEHQRGLPKPAIELSNHGDVSPCDIAREKFLTFPQSAQGLTSLAELRQDRGGRGER